MSEKQGELIFALDIGTRKIMGVVARPKEKGLEILDAELIEHQTRAMLDGQIHDIEETAAVVRAVKQTLEERLGLKLDHTAVAVAGRALMTRKEEASLQISEAEPITEEDIQRLELEAVQKGQRDLQRQHPRGSEYHCVGYASLEYRLNGEPMTNLLGHRGRNIHTTILATFLPGLVVDSLQAVLQKVGLTVQSMTLEPIAASNVVIPPSLRNLNLALVDIGAGTSDIAVTRQGSVVGYGMIPLAGDEVTERLSESYLMDFTAAEKVKRELATAEEVAFQDILGYQHQHPVKEILKEIDPVVDSLATAIVETILGLNGGAPGAVICIGGGSLTPLLTQKIAGGLGLKPERVVSRGLEAISVPLSGKKELLGGPQAVTPVGIAYTARQAQVLAVKQMVVKVNGQPVRLLNLNEIKVSDALLGSGMDMRYFYGKIGMSLTVRVNGEFVVVKGTPGIPGKVFRGQEEVTLETILKDGDEITVEPGTDGKDATALLKDLIPSGGGSLKVTLNDKELTLGYTLLMNGEEASPDTPVPDGAEIVCRIGNRFKDAILASDEPVPAGDLTCRINGEEKTFPRRARCLRNGEPADLETLLEDGDRLEYRPAIPLLVKDILPQNVGRGKELGLNVMVNGQPLFIPSRAPKVMVNGKTAGLADPVPDNAVIQVAAEATGNVYFAEVFNYVPMNLQEHPQGKRLQLLLNGRAAEYTASLKEGDTIEIKWVDEEKRSTQGGA